MKSMCFAGHLNSELIGIVTQGWNHDNFSMNAMLQLTSGTRRNQLKPHEEITAKYNTRKTKRDMKFHTRSWYRTEQNFEKNHHCDLYSV